MERVSRFRSRILMLLFIVVVGFLAYTLYDLQIIETGGNTDNTTTYTSWVRVKAARGDILDSNGNVLVSNRASYDLVINHYVLVNANGTNDYYFVNDPKALGHGRAINPIDIQDRARVCLIDSDIVEQFFYGVNPIGKTLYINSLEFTVIGLLAEDEELTIANILTGSPSILMPYTTALKMNGASLVNALTVYMDNPDSTTVVKEELEEKLDELFSYEDDTYTITTMESIEDTMETMMSMMSGLLAGIASIALVVGGIGIMNMMLTSVTERTVEIGLKKAIGAEPGQIQMQFLIESFLLSMLGGMMGVVLGIVLSAVLCMAMDIDFAISYGAIALGAGFSAAVGIIFGWSPARKASKLSPIDALRRM